MSKTLQQPNSSLDKVLSDNCGKTKHDLRDVKKGDTLIRDVYNHGQFHGVVTVVEFKSRGIDAKGSVLLSNGDTCHVDSGESTTSAITWYRKPQPGEVEKQEWKHLVGHLAYFEWETLDIKTLRLFSNKLQEIVDARREQISNFQESKNQKETFRNNLKLIEQKGLVTGKWKTVGSGILLEDTAVQQVKFSSKNKRKKKSKKRNKKKLRRVDL